MNENLEREIIRYKVPFASNEECLYEETLNKIAYHFAEWERTRIVAEIEKRIAQCGPDGNRSNQLMWCELQAIWQTLQVEE